MDTPTLIIVAVIAGVLVGLTVFAIMRGRQPRPSALSTRRLSRTSAALGAALKDAWGSGLDESTWDEIEEGLLGSDVGVAATGHIVNGLRSAKPESVNDARSELASLLRAELNGGERGLSLTGHPAVVLVVGVNGTGKTTTIAKLANRLKQDGKSVVLGAADTFRAAAGEQLETWARRVDVDVVTGQEGGDPASVAFDAVSAAQARGADVVIIDTAGRLHDKKNLMGELEKIHRVVSGHGGVDEVLLVLDATAGQNGLTQVFEFSEAVPVSGIVLTKLDGTAKGGIVIAIEKELGVPVKFIGLGEGMDDLEPFEPDSFVDALLEDS